MGPTTAGTCQTVSGEVPDQMSEIKFTSEQSMKREEEVNLAPLFVAKGASQ